MLVRAVAHASDDKMLTFIVGRQLLLQQLGRFSHSQLQFLNETVQVINTRASQFKDTTHIANMSQLLFHVFHGFFMPKEQWISKMKM